MDFIKSDKKNDLENSVIKDIDNKKGVVTLQISQFNKYDSDRDRMLKGAFDYTFKNENQVHLLDHKVGTGTFVGLPINKCPDSLIIESQLNLNKTIGKDLLSDYEFGLKFGRSLQHSQGFTSKKGDYEENEKGGFDFKQVSMHEYSTVLFGAESQTPVHSVKSDKSVLDYLELMNERLKFGFVSHERGLEIEKHLNIIKQLLEEPVKEIKSAEEIEEEEKLKREKELNEWLKFLNE